MLGKNFLFHITGRQLVIFNPVENYVQAFGIETSGFQFGDKNEMVDGFHEHKGQGNLTHGDGKVQCFNETQ